MEDEPVHSVDDGPRLDGELSHDLEHVVDGAGSAYEEADAAEPGEVLDSEEEGSEYSEGEEDKVDFEPSMVAQGLSGLAMTAEGTSVAYTELDLTHTTLSDSYAVAHCQQLQRVNLAHNSLTSLAGLGQLQHIMHLDASCNRLTQVLDLQLPASQPISPLLTADLSHNHIQHIQDLGRYSRLTRLVLDGNKIEAVAGLKGLQQLRVLSLQGNALKHCKGLQGLTSLQQVHLDNNQLVSLTPLSSCCQLQLLTAAHNCISSCSGTGALTSLRHLDISSNQIRRLEAVAELRAATLMTSLNILDNLLQQARHCRLHLVHLLPQLLEVDGQRVAPGETVEAADMHGAEASGLAAIRKRFFPNGELDDGGGAIPPTAAGLVASKAEEEVTLGSATAATVLTTLDQAVAGISADLAQQGLQLLADALMRCCSTNHHQRGAAGRISSSNSNASGSSSANGPNSNSQVYLQWKLARACYSWVVNHVLLPQALAAGDAGTWEVEPPLFAEAGWEAALLDGATGTWAERVVQLYVTLAKGVHLEAVQLTGLWRDSDAMAVAPGDTLVTHNHSWAAVKVNGRWRLLDPVYGALKRSTGRVPWYTPPGAFLYTHLPFQSYWQLVGDPVTQEAWWSLPEVTPTFFDVGCQLLDPGLGAVTTLPAARAGQPLPTMHMGIAAPDWPHQQLQLQLRDSSNTILARWNTLTSTSNSSSSSNSSPGSWNSQSWSKQQQQQQRAAATAAGSSDGDSVSGREGAGEAPATLLYQQSVLGPSGVIQVTHGAEVHAARLQDMWAALPAPGSYNLQVVLYKETPGWMSLRVEGLEQPLMLSRREEEVLVNLKVVVPEPAADTVSSSCLDLVNPITHLPQLPPTASKPLGLPRSASRSSSSSSRGSTARLPAVAHQLVSPKPGKQMEADRLELFEIVAPTAVALVLGQPGQSWMSLPPAPGRPGVFAGMVVLPRSSVLQVRALPNPAAAAGNSDGAEGPSSSSSSRAASGGRNGPGSSSLGPRSTPAPAPLVVPPPEEWVLLMSLAVQPQVQTLLVVPDPCPLPEVNPCAPWMPRLRKMLASLDVDGDGRVSRKDMLKAFRRDRQLADHLHMPPRIKVGDGTFDKFLVKFIAMNKDGLGYIEEQQLAAYLGLGAAGEGEGGSGWELQSNAPSSSSKMSKTSRAAPSKTASKLAVMPPGRSSVAGALMSPGVGCTPDGSSKAGAFAPTPGRLIRAGPSSTYKL